MTDLVPTRDHIELATSMRKMLDKRSDSQAAVSYTHMTLPTIYSV